MFGTNLDLDTTPARYCTFIVTAAEGMPFATTCSKLTPRSWAAGTSKWVDSNPEFATPIVVGSCVRL